MPPETVQAGRPAPDPDWSSQEQPSETQLVDSGVHDPPNDAEDLPLDVIFELLQNQRRRRVLRHLETVSESVDLGTLAEHLAAEENDKSVKALTSSERKRVYICLYQCHLPKLDDAGVVAFDSDRGTIEQTERTAELTSYLDRLTEARSSDPEPAHSWPARYLGITFVGGGLYALQTTMFPSAILSHALMGVFVGALLVSSLTHADLP